MILDDIKKYLSNIIDVEGVQGLGKKQDHILISCPMARWTHLSGQDAHPSCMVWYNDEKQTYYKCYSCGECGNLWQLFQEYGQKTNDPQVQALALEVLKVDTPSISSRFVRLYNKILNKYDLDVFEDEVKIVPASVIEKYELATLNPIASKYLEGRQVDVLTALRFNLRWDKHNFRICFPAYDEDGSCVGMVGRTVPPGDVEKKRYFNYFNFNAAESLGGTNFVKDYPYNKILVLEGYFDLLRSWQWCVELGILPVCTWKSKVSEKQLTKLVGFDKLLICGYDNDKAGQEGAVKFIREGGQLGATVRKLQLPEGKDVGELTKEEFINSLKTTKTFNSRKFEND